MEEKNKVTIYLIDGYIKAEYSVSDIRAKIEKASKMDGTGFISVIDVYNDLTDINIQHIVFIRYVKEN